MEQVEAGRIVIIWVCGYIYVMFKVQSSRCEGLRAILLGRQPRPWMHQTPQALIGRSLLFMASSRCEPVSSCLQRSLELEPEGIRGYLRHQIAFRLTPGRRETASFAFQSAASSTCRRARSLGIRSQCVSHMQFVRQSPYPLLSNGAPPGLPARRARSTAPHGSHASPTWSAGCSISGLRCQCLLTKGKE
jgi:hypothetical protein